MSPTSRGTVTLASASPFDAPLIDPAYLNTTLDLYIMRAAIRSAAQFFSAQTWDGFVTGRGAGFANVDLTSDDAIDAWSRSEAGTLWHAVGTARMGSCNDTDSVVDPNLRVRGTKGLRIVDASIFVRILCSLCWLFELLTWRLPSRISRQHIRKQSFTLSRSVLQTLLNMEDSRAEG